MLIKTKLFFYSWFAVAPADFVRLPSSIKTKIKAGLKNFIHVLVLVGSAICCKYSICCLLFAALFIENPLILCS
jgi:hypothetical protein